MNKLLGHSEDFLIKHYAGDVVYTVTGKSNDNQINSGSAPLS